MSLSNLLDNFIEAKKAFQAQAQESLKEAFKEVFDLHPEITAFVWTQYTPYFNDGEPCEFSVGDVNITNIPLDSEMFEDITPYGEYDGEEEVYTAYGSIGRDAEFFVVNQVRGTNYRTHAPTGPAVFDGKDTSKLEKLLRVLNDSSFEDIMKSTFGDHVRVVATRNGFDIDEYNHD